MSDSSKQHSQFQKFTKVDKLNCSIRDVLLQKKTQQFFRLMTQKNKLVFLDHTQQFVIVKYKYLSQLQSIVSSQNANLDKLSQNIRTQEIQRKTFNKILQQKEQQISRLKQQIKISKKGIQELEKITQSQQQIIDQKYTQIEKLLQKHKNELIRLQNMKPAPQSKKVFAQMGENVKQSKYVQTLYDTKLLRNINRMQQQKLDFAPQISSNNENLASKQANNVSRYEEELKKLKQNFQTVIQQVNSKTKQKLTQIQSQKLDVERWAQQNKKLKQQNTQLKQRIRKINEQEQKIKIWKSTLQNFAEKVQSEYQKKTKNLSQSVNEDVQHQRQNIVNQHNRIQQQSNLLKDQKIKTLQATIDRIQSQKREKQQKLSQIKSIIQSPEQINLSEQNIVTNLLSLSFKVKEVVRFLLQEL